MFWTLWSVAGVGAIVTTLLPWRRLFETGAARYVLYAWSNVGSLVALLALARARRLAGAFGADVDYGPAAAFAASVPL